MVQKSQLQQFLKSEVEPIPIEVPIDNVTRTLGHVFVDRFIEINGVQCNSY